MKSLSADRQRNLCFPFLENGSYVSVVHGDKVSSVFPWSKEVHDTEDRQLRANLSIYPSTKLSLGYQSSADIYIYIFFFLSNPLISLSLFICAPSCREVTYTFLILFHDSIVGDICSNDDDDDDDDNPQEQATSIFESCDVRGELVIGVGARSWTRFARSPRFYRRSKSLEIEKDPFLGVTEKKEAAPLVRQSGKSRGLEPFRAKAVYVMSLGS